MDAQKTSEEKSPKISKRNTTPEVLPAVKISTPSTPLPVNDIIEEFLRRAPTSDCNVRRKGLVFETKNILFLKES